jgi:hypothetical protein
LADDTDEMADIRAELEATAKEPDKKVPAEQTAAEQEAEEAKEPEAEESEAEQSADEGEETADEKKADPEKKKTESKRYLLREQLKKERESVRARDARIAELEAELAARKTAKEDDAEDADQKPQAKTEAQIREEIRADERRKAARDDFLRQSNAAFDKGVEVFGKPEFEEAAATLNDIGMNEDIVEAMLATDAPERVIFQLAQDVEEARRVFSLPPLKRAAAMAKVAASRPRLVKTSEAAPPIRPVGGKSGESEDIYAPNASDAAIDAAVAGSLKRMSEKYG